MPQIDQWQPAWLKEYVAGLSSRAGWEIEAESEHFAVCKSPGGSYWNGHMTMYGKVQRVLVDKSKDWWSDRSRVDVHEGRVLYRHRHKITDALAEAEHAYATLAGSVCSCGRKDFHSAVQVEQVTR